jgi:hypothetical protein
MSETERSFREMGDGWIVVTTHAGRVEVEEAQADTPRRGRPAGAGSLDEKRGPCAELNLHFMV